jgi:hypothetical protein
MNRWFTLKQLHNFFKCNNIPNITMINYINPSAKYHISKQIKNYFNIYYYHSIRISDRNKNIIGGIDYKFLPNNKTKVEYFNASNFIIYNLLLNHVEKEMPNTNEILLDVHENLERYNKTYKYLGFNLTNNKCTENPFWVVSTKKLKK